MTRVLLSIGLSLFRLIPFWLLYRLSDGLYYIFYYMIRVRRRIVRHNIQFVFPNKSLKEIKAIERQAYRNFCDIILETAKGFTLSPQAMAKRYHLTNPEILDPYYAQNRSIVAFIAHMNNWEWGISIQQSLKHKAFYIYKRLHNRAADTLVREKRQVAGAELVYKEQMARTLIKNRRKAGFYALIADQRPSGDQDQHQVQFFGHQISCFSGPESIAKTFDYPVVYCRIDRIKRGYYQGTGILVTDDPKSMPEGAISQACFSLLAQQIREYPGNWMWMHRRFKNMEG